ncbi:hypothetical protein GDO86_016459 [Hymenochirus boettgeri]|uniref:G-protein coupled receptors family 1 profile domain-containing protein n=1 Tax=Hymenochirus boettgeri TaxID=247094 RepID=A0A8T2JX62_9PIPI|nr:hypothetical protein GDO86_016459 [Hymenochirus boettgeri]
MEKVNQTTLGEFILLAFSDLGQIQHLLFYMLILIYIVCIGGNVAIILLIKAEPSLHIPMYFFIGTLSALETMFVSCIIPKLLANLIAADMRISFIGCVFQVFVSHTLGTAECYLLAVMAFDRDLAINNPLRYLSIMTHELSVNLAILPFIVGVVCVIIPTVLTSGLDFCGPNAINHFYCDLVGLQSLACSDHFIIQIFSSCMAFIAAVVPFIITIGFYIHIIRTIFFIHSSKGKVRAFSTCSSHLSIVGVYYITAIVVYVIPKGNHYDRYLSLLYTVITPLLNPFIYSYRNKDVKNALLKLTRVKNGQASF